MLSVEALRRILGLVPHPVEGGYFTETYRSADPISASGLPSRYRATRAASTFSAMHRLAIIVLGPDLEAGQRPHVVVPRDTWQGARLIPGGQYALVGTTVAPGFDYTDYETAPAPPPCYPPHRKDLTR